MRIGLIPLDERPVNTRYPVMIAAAAGVEVVLPPLTLLSRYRLPADPEALIAWLIETAPTLDALIFSVEMLGCGGLIASRVTNDPATMILNRLEVLRTVRQQHPHLVIYGFNVITRIPAYNSNIEEPDYWGDYGYRLHQWSALLDRASQGQDVERDLIAVRDDIPPQHRDNFLKRRLRNHTVNLGVLGLCADGVIDTLVLSSDDTSEYGLSSREKRWLAGWVDLVGVGRVLMYPGADEVGCALVARLLNDPAAPALIAVHYAIPDDADVIAPYEDGAVRITVARQIEAVGGVEADVEAAPYILAVNPPSRIRREFDPAQAEAERLHRTPYLEAFVQQIKTWLDAGKYVIIADVAYPNGADPVLIDLLRQYIDPTHLAAYGAWNTAGNTIGTALAQGIAASRITSDDQREAHEQFLLHRFIEDWGYQHRVRDEVRDWLEAQTGIREVSAENIDTVNTMIESQLGALLATLPGFAKRWRITPGSVRLPWNRTFEVDFDLERVHDLPN